MKNIISAAQKIVNRYSKLRIWCHPDKSPITFSLDGINFSASQKGRTYIVHNNSRIIVDVDLDNVGREVDLQMSIGWHINESAPNDVLHRDNGPALLHYYGTSLSLRKPEVLDGQFIYLGGLSHYTNGLLNGLNCNSRPTLCNGKKINEVYSAALFSCGKMHNLDGPADVTLDDRGDTTRWFINGEEQVTEVVDDTGQVLFMGHYTQKEDEI